MIDWLTDNWGLIVWGLVISVIVVLHWWALMG